MADYPIDLTSGLHFGERNTENEQLLDCSYATRLGNLSARRKHEVRFALGHRAYTLRIDDPLGLTYALDTNGRLTADSVLKDTGYSTSVGTLLSLVPNTTISDIWLFIAADKMSKYNGTVVEGWGVPAPTASALTIASIVPVEPIIIDDFDTTASWTATNCTIVNEGTIVATGSGSGKVTLTANQIGTIDRIGTQFPSGTPVNFNVVALVSFWIRVDDIAALRGVSIEFDLDNSGFNGAIAHYDLGQEFVPQYPPTTGEVLALTLPQIASGDVQGQLQAVGRITDTQLPNTSRVWKQIFLDLARFYISPGYDFSTVYNIRFKFLATTNLVLYLDESFGSPEGQDDANGARYKYAYKNSVTHQQGNLNATPSAAAAGQHGVVNIQGAVAPPSGYGIDTLVLYRDVGGDGNYAVVKEQAIGGGPFVGNFTDQVPVASLGDVDTNDNAVPPHATRAVEFMGRVWLNDLSNSRRVWRSQAGRYESFKDFFIVGAIEDTVLGFAVIRSQLFIITRQSILQVVGDDTAPSFLSVLSVGTFTPYSYYVGRDFIVFAHMNGIALFDSAQVIQLPRIERLFDLQNVLVERLGTASPDSCILGCDDKYVWFYYIDSGSVEHQLNYSFETKRWVEESTMLTAHATSHTEIRHIAASKDGNVYNIYYSTDWERLFFTSHYVEAQPIGHLNGVRIEYSSGVDIQIQVQVDDTVVILTTLPSTSVIRQWVYIPTTTDITLPITQRLNVLLASVVAGECEIYNLICSTTEIKDTDHYNSEYISTGSNLTALVEIQEKVLGIENGNIVVDVDVDGQRIKSVTRAILRNQLLVQREVVTPTVGRAIRLQLTGGRFHVVHLIAKLVDLGNGEVKSVVLTPN